MAFGDDPRRDPLGDLPPNPFAAPQSVEEEGVRVPARPGEMTLNPWISIWTKPRATIRQLIDTNGAEQAPLVVAVAGAANGINNATNSVETVGLMPALAGGVIGGVIFGFLFWLLFSWLLKVTGGWLGGQATLTDMRTANAWAQVPSVWVAPFSVALILLGGENPPETLANNPAIAIAFMVIGLLMIVVGIWAFIVMCKAIGEAHLFSAWLGFAAFLISCLLAGAMMMAVVVPIVILFAAAA